MKTLGIIPARGGSKGIPKKNLVKLMDKSLLEHAIFAGKGSRYINNLFVSTDDSEILKAAEQLECKVINRPSSLATDTSSSFDVVKHAIDFVEKEESFFSRFFSINTANCTI